MSTKYGTSPLPIGEYSRVMVEMFDDREFIEEPTGFQSFFGRGRSKTLYTDDALSVDIEIRRGNEKTAKMVPRGTSTRMLGPDFKNMDIPRSSLSNRVFPMIKEENDIHADQTFWREMGMTEHASASRFDKFRSIAMDGHMEQVRRIVRTNEILASQSIILGTQDAILGTADTGLQYDFQRNANLTFAAPVVWTGAADITGDLDNMCIRLRQYGHKRARGAILGTGALDALIKDSTVQATADNRRYELIRIEQAGGVPSDLSYMVAGGFVPYGLFRTNKGYELWLFTYPEFYQNDAGTFVSYMPTDKVVVFSTNARADRYFGPSDVLPANLSPSRQQLFREFLGFDSQAAPMPAGIMNASAVINPAMFHFDMYTNEDFTTVTQRTECAPIFATIDTDSYCTLTGVV
jgi:hypothetical protein